MYIFTELGIEPIEFLLIVVGIMAGLLLLILILLIVQMVKHKKLKKLYEAFMEGSNGKSLEEEVLARFQEVDSIRDHMNKIDERLNGIDQILLQTFKKMAIIKYDAFDEMGGKLSFALALLTAKNDGCIINSMHSSREGCYTYIKIIEAGKCDATLSEEEKLALQQAIDKQVIS